MPHLFFSRPRLHNLFSNDPSQEQQFPWERINAVAYEFGGAVFVSGSILFFPSMADYADVGAWIFIVGSLLYVLVAAHDLAEVVRHSYLVPGSSTIWERLEFAAAIAYFAGSVLFTAGSIGFLSTVNRIDIAAWCFVIGSLLFVGGAIVNVLQIVRAQDLFTLQLMNLTALSFVTGSVLFAVASVPYLWHFANPEDRETVDSFVAWQYLAGSALFLLGGIFNHRRAYRVMRRFQ